MSVRFVAVQWNRHKVVYDVIALAFVVVSLVAFVAVGVAMARPEDRGTPPLMMGLLIRGCGVTAFVLLHIILCIGPLARLDARFSALLYNRRHLGVLTCLVGVAHAALVVMWFHAFGNVNPLVSLLSSNTNFFTLSAFPFEALGIAALVILGVMALTSHDFWLKALGPRAWKGIHMLVYVAYVLLVLHVALGLLRSEPSPVLPILLGVGVLTVSGLHFFAGRRQVRRDRTSTSATPSEGWCEVSGVGDIEEGRARLATLPSGDEVAVFRHGGCFSAVSNRCAHQGGPLAEGKIVDGCITCPWHGYQYRPEDGQSPPPYTERLRTYRVRIEGEQVQVHEEALAPGTATEPARVAGAPSEDGEDQAGRGFYVGYLSLPGPHRRFLLGLIPSVFLLSMALQGMVVASFRDPGDGFWNLDVDSAQFGVLAHAPYPVLRIPGDAPGTVETILVVSEGKFGASDQTIAFDGRFVQLRGHMLERGSRRMIELSGEGAITTFDSDDDEQVATLRSVEMEDLGEQTLRGEIVDSRCFLGTMKPGEGLTHKACATRCVAGGVPPMLVVATEEGPRGYLVANGDGSAAGVGIHRFVGDQIEVTGQVVRAGDLRSIRIDPGDICRIGGIFGATCGP